MGKIGILFFAVGLFAQEVETRNPRTSSADVAAGAKTFRSHCAECHGLNAEGGRGPNLASGRFFHGSSDADLLKNIGDGIQETEMPGLFYSSDRIWQVIAYIRSLNKSGREQTKGDATAGKAVYQSAGCPQCHRIDGEGRRLGPDLSDVGRVRAPEHLRAAIIDPGADVRERYWVVNLKTKNGSSQTGFLMNEDTYSVQFMDLSEQLHSVTKADLADFTIEKVSKMPSYKDNLEARQLDDLVAYLSSLRPKGGVR